MKSLITGCGGFVGSNFKEYLHIEEPYSVVYGLSRPTYADSKIETGTFYGDLCNEELMMQILKGVDIVYHFAAESHVDNSYVNPCIFADSNVKGTLSLLEAARKRNVMRIIHFSTDECYGDELKDFKEEDKFNPTNPYSASKAAAEMFVNAYKQSYDMDIRIIRSNNIFGPGQNKEKLIPRTIWSCMLREKIPVHGHGEAKRKYIYVEDICRAVVCVSKLGERQGIYNVAGEYEARNIDVVHEIVDRMHADRDLIEFVRDRPHNDRQYSINCDKIKELGWHEKVGFHKGLSRTIASYHWGD